MSDFRLVDPSQIQHAIFIRRPNRFIVECLLNGNIILAFLPNPGRLWELLFPGRKLMISKKRADSKRKTDYTVLAVIVEDHPIMLDTHSANSLAEWLVSNNMINGLEGWKVKRAEVKYKRSRNDFLLHDGKHDYYLEVKSCTLFGKDIAMFPDSPSERASIHIIELAELAKKGYRCGILFIIQSPFPRYFLPDFHTDPLFAKYLSSARDLLDIFPVPVYWENDLKVSRVGGSLEIPWAVMEKESGDRGSYLVILELENVQSVSVSSHEKRYFRSGYYVYIASAAKDLDRKMARDGRKRKNSSYYLRDLSRVIKVLPVRSSVSLEQDLTKAVHALSDNKIPSFAFSSYNTESDLFYFESNPLKNEGFIKALFFFRMDNLMNLLNLDHGKDA